MKIIKIISIGLIGLLSISMFFNCDNSTGSGDNTGRLAIQLTDDPFPAEFVEQANITINKIEIREKGTEENPFITVSEETQNYNLLDLRNGVTETLTNIELTEGNYDLVRLYIEDAEVVLDNDTKYDLKIPSGAQTGLKLFIEPDITVEGGLTKELLIDVDVSKSFRVQGNADSPAGIRGFIFRPVLRVVNLSTAGRVVGTVADSEDNPIADASVWVEKDSVISTTFSDSEGAFTLIGIPEGTYTLGAYKADYDSTLINDIEVIAGNQTDQSIELIQKEGQ